MGVFAVGAPAGYQEISGDVEKGSTARDPPYAADWTVAVGDFGGDVPAKTCGGRTGRRLEGPTASTARARAGPVLRFPLDGSGVIHVFSDT